jgi:hypothetical protein
MQTIDLAVDFNGLVLFDPTRLENFLGGPIVEGTNLWQRFTTTEDGDEVVNQGIVVPILGINDGSYRVVVRQEDERSVVSDPVVVENGEFPLSVQKRLVLADMAVLLEWTFELGWHDLDVSPGYYRVTIRGFRAIEHSRITRCGYEIVLAPAPVLPPMTASLEKNMQVLTLER